MLTRPLLIATIATGLSVASFSTHVSADPGAGFVVGGTIGAVVGGPRAPSSARSSAQRSATMRTTAMRTTTGIATPMVRRPATRRRRLPITHRLPTTRRRRRSAITEFRRITCRRRLPTTLPRPGITPRQWCTRGLNMFTGRPVRTTAVPTTTRPGRPRVPRQDERQAPGVALNSICALTSSARLLGQRSAELIFPSIPASGQHSFSPKLLP